MDSGLHGLEEFGNFKRDFFNTISKTVKNLATSAHFEIIRLLDSGQNAAGEALPPLALSTIKRKRREGKPMTPRVEHNRDLKRSLKVQRESKYTYVLLPVGADRNGVSNQEKLRWLKLLNPKYRVLEWTPHLVKMLQQALDQVFK